MVIKPKTTDFTPAEAEHTMVIFFYL